MTIEERIARALINYLDKVHGIQAVHAFFDETTSADYSSGCDTCGYGSDDMSFEIGYKTAEDRHFRYRTISGDPLNFLPTLFEYDY